MTVREPPMPDLYGELEVAPEATAEAVRAAYVALAKRYHPDRNPTYAATQRMQRINDAYAVLGNEAKRALYDAALAQQAEAALAARAELVPVAPVTPSWHARLLYHAPRMRRYAAYLGGAATVLVLLIVALIAARGFGGGGSKAESAPTAASRIVRDQITAGATPVATLHAAAIIAAAAQYPGFGEVDALRDASHGVTAADRGWSFQLLGCSVLAGEYDAPDRAQAAIAYWRGNVHADEVDAGNLVLGVSGCPNAAALSSVIAGLRAIVAGQPASAVR
jgi:hypothetical protein